MVKNLVSFTNQKPKKTRIDSHLAAYATLAGVALAAPAVAKADIVYSGMVNISVPNNFDGVYINFVTGQTGTSGASVPGWNWNPYNGGTGLQFFWNGTPNGGLSLDTTTYAVLPNGAPISSANVYLNTTSTAATAVLAKQSWNGWVFWEVAAGPGGTMAKLDDIRKKAISQKAASEE